MLSTLHSYKTTYINILLMCFYYYRLYNPHFHCHHRSTRYDRTKSANKSLTTINPTTTDITPTTIGYTLLDANKKFKTLWKGINYIEHFCKGILDNLSHVGAWNAAISLPTVCSDSRRRLCKTIFRKLSFSSEKSLQRISNLFRFKHAKL